MCYRMLKQAHIYFKMILTQQRKNNMKLQITFLIKRGELDLKLHWQKQKEIQRKVDAGGRNKKMS